MKNCISSGKAKQFVLKATFLVVSLFSAFLLVMPAAVQAMTVTVTVDSATHPVGAEVVVTAVADGSLWWSGLHFAILDGGPNFPYEGEVSTVHDNGLWVSTFTYESNGKAGVDTIEVYANYWDGTFTDKGSATVEWIDDSPKSASVDIVARPKLNVKKRGAFKIAICNTNDFNVHDVDVESVKLMGVEPVRWKHKDKEYCPGGEDGFVDLVFKFKNQQVVKALKKALARDLVHGEVVDLELTGSFNDDRPALEVKVSVEIKNKSKAKRIKERIEKKCKKKKEKMAKN